MGVVAFILNFTVSKLVHCYVKSLTIHSFLYVTVLTFFLFASTFYGITFFEKKINATATIVTFFVA